MKSWVNNDIGITRTKGLSIKKHHSVLGGNMVYRCTKCGRCFPTLDDLYQHRCVEGDHCHFRNIEEVDSCPTSSGGCAITTAACQVYGMDNDCEVLSAFRNFRDTVMIENPEWKQLVELYYKISPDIVKKINEREDGDEIYRYAMENFIKPAYEQIKKGNSEKAIEIYAKGVIFAKNLVSDN